MTNVNLNRLPYFDDFDEQKNYHKILFKPGVAVQARELTQLQTVLQNQIERFGDHVFKNGSRVLGGSFDPQDPVQYVRVQANISDLSGIVGAELTGGVTGLKARVIHAEEDPNEVGISVLFINYTDSNNSTEIETFTNETITYVGTNRSGSFLTAFANTTGTGSIFGITEGVLYVRGYFARFDSQKIAVDPFTEKANKKVYFSANFSIVDSDEDPTLLDNAQGYNNFNAPGADRLRCELTLNTSNLDEDLSDENNYLLLELRNGQIYEKNERTVYNEVANELARRTYDESGDYVVRGWGVRTREHLNTGTNGGRYTSEEGGDENKVVVELEKGLAYVKGYEVETISTRAIDIDKSTDYEFVDNQFSYVPSGPHVIANEISGLPSPDTYEEVELYDTAEARVTNAVSYNVGPVGDKIGTAQLMSYVEEDGQFGTPSASMRFYIGDIVMNDGTDFSNVRSIRNANFFADIELNKGNAVLYDSGNNSRLIYVGTDHTRSIKNPDDNSEFSLTFSKQGTGTITTSGLLSGVVTLGANETLIYGTNSSLGSLAKETIMVNTVEGGVVSLPGTISSTSGSTQIVGTGTTFTNLNEGDRLRIDGSLYTIDSIISDVELNVAENTSSTYSGSYTKEYVAGDIIDLNSKGADNGQFRSVSVTPSSISIDLNETFTTQTDVKAVYRVVKNPVPEVPKNIRAKRYVKIDGSTASSLDTFYLGVSDVLRIKQIRKHSSEITDITDGTDATVEFDFFKNQTAFSYNTSFVKSKAPISNTEHLLIEFDYYEPDFSGSGTYFSMDSYPINDTFESDTTIKTAELSDIQRNFIDFRAFKASTVTPGTTIALAPENPTNSTTFNVPVGGYRSPVPGTNLTFDYSFYISRKDVLAIRPNGEFKVFRGQPGVNSAFPKVPDTYMMIANISVTPFPSLSKNYAKILGVEERGMKTEKVTYSRHTMADISAIKNRVSNLEYYTALNSLEKDTLDLSIPDENGLDRFKNGVFINAFVDHSLSDTSTSDYNIAIDKRNKNIQPAYDVDGFDSNYSSGANITKSGAIVHLPFVEKPLREQLFATTTRNIELSSYRYIGDLNLYPDVDTWVDTKTVDKLVSTGDDIPEEQIIQTSVGSWSSTSTGAVSGQPSNTYKVYHREFGDKKFDGNEKLLKTFNTAEEVKNYIASGNFVNSTTAKHLSSKLSKQPGALSGSLDLSDPKVQKQLDQSSHKRYFISYGGQVTTDEKITQERTSTEMIINSETETNDLGTFVTDASLIPYIRPQTIKLYAYGLKPNTKFHAFFDGENMNDHVTPVEVSSYFDANTAQTSGYLDYDTDLTNLGFEGNDVYSNDRGEVLAFLKLPTGTSKRFRVGEKEVVITDSPTNDSDASSYSKSTFIASGLNLQKQRTILSTKTRTFESRSITDTRQQTVQRTSNTPNGWFETGPSCAAYSVYIDEEEDVEGIFMSSVDIWLSALHPTLGIWFEIREMSEDGNITRNTLPYSTVWMNRDDTRLKVSEDGITNATNVNFDSPVFLYNKTQYAFVIHTEGLNPDTYFWVSRLGGTDVVSGNPVTSRALFGTFYTTNNNLNWDIVPDLDLKVRFNRASFGGQPLAPVSGSATFTIEDVEFISSNTAIPGVFFDSGEPVRGTEIIKIAVDDLGAVSVGDTIVDGTSNTSAEIIDIDGTDLYMNGFDYIVGSNVAILDANTSNEKATGTVSSVDFGVGVISDTDTTKRTFEIIHSNGKFFVGSKLRSILPNRHKTVLNGKDISVTYSGAGTRVPNPFAPTGTITLPVGLSPASTTAVPEFTIEQFGTFDYAASTIRPSYINFDGDTTMSFQTQGTIEDTVSSFITVSPNSNYEYRNIHNILSRSEEVRLLDGEKSFKVRVNMSSTSDFITPVIDSSLMGVVFTNNQLNDDVSGETEPRGGNLESKYLSSIIQLTDDNAAEDLRIILQEYRPASTDIRVWARIKSNADIEELTDKYWFELESQKTAVSSNVNKENYIDTTYTIPEERLTGDQGAVQYTISGNLAVIDGSDMTANTEYVIHSTGTTDFTDYGANTNVVGTKFTATGPANGDGTVSLADDLIFTRFTELQLKVGMIGTNRAVYPKAAQLRTIALQK